MMDGDDGCVCKLTGELVYILSLIFGCGFVSGLIVSILWFTR